MRVNPDLKAGCGTVYEVIFDESEAAKLQSVGVNSSDLAANVVRQDQAGCERQARTDMTVDEWQAFRCGIVATQDIVPPSYWRGEEPESATIVRCGLADRCRGAVERNQLPAQRTARAVATEMRKDLHYADLQESKLKEKSRIETLVQA